MLGNHCAHQQAAIASPLNRQFFGARVLFLNQVFRRSGEVIEYILFFREIPSLVPVFTELSTPSDIRHYVYPAVVKPKATRKIEIGRHADSVASIAIKQCWILAVPFHSLWVNDVEWNFRAVLRGCEFAGYFDVSK